PTIVDGRLVMPGEPRARAESAIGEFGDVLGVAFQCKRVLRSPRPCVALRPESPDEAAAIVGVPGLRREWLSHPQAQVMPPVVPARLAPALADRLDGLALLADSLGDDNAVARARELFRLFERAFGRCPSAA